MRVIAGPGAVMGMDDTVWPPPGPSPAGLASLVTPESGPGAAAPVTCGWAGVSHLPLTLLEVRH